jgi:hypothetical protein
LDVLLGVEFRPFVAISPSIQYNRSKFLEGGVMMADPSSEPRLKSHGFQLDASMVMKEGGGFGM